MDLGGQTYQELIRTYRQSADPTLKLGIRLALQELSESFVSKGEAQRAKILKDWLKHEEELLNSGVTAPVRAPISQTVERQVRTRRAGG